jgi:2-C-methyl-D-erythritol 2,4-cyclodiphosphate synthase
MNDFRSGIGIDAHAFAEDRRLVLGGVEIASSGGLAGHSDADVLIHAIVDALLGAAAMGDIGRHFPDSDARFKNISSLLLLGETRNILAADRWSVSNVDATIVAQRPRLGEHIAAMRQRIAETLGVEITRVSVKATTTEKLGFTGREEGIAAVAVATVCK